LRQLLTYDTFALKNNNKQG